MKNIFEHLQTVEEVKKLYRTKAFEFHPDCGGSDELMKELNNAYHAKLKSLNGQESKDNANKTHQYYYNEKIEQELIEKIYSLQTLRMQNVEIALIGTWLWITGNTKPYAEQLGKNGLGLRFSGEKQAWYFHTGSYHRRSAKSGNFSAMAMKYGYTKLNEFKQEKLN